MNNDKGEMTQNDERPLSNRETREALRIMHCLGIRKDYHDGPIEEGDHAEIAKRRRRVRAIPSDMKHFYKGYKPDALRAKDTLVILLGQLLGDDGPRVDTGEWLQAARTEEGNMLDVIELSLVHNGVYDSHKQVRDTIRLVTEPSFAAKLWGADETEEVAA